MMRARRFAKGQPVRYPTLHAPAPVSTRPCSACAIADTEAAHKAPAQSQGADEQTCSLSHYVTGGRLGSTGSSRCLFSPEKLPLPCDKQIVLVRHGMSTWNLQSRIQGSSDEPELTDFGKEQVRSLDAPEPQQICGG